MITLNRIDRVIQSQGGEPIYLTSIRDWQLNSRSTTWRPDVDVIETTENIIIRMEAAGMQNANFQIELSHQMVKISGCRTDPGPRMSFHRMEIFFGEFLVEVQIPTLIDTSQAEAQYTDGFLLISLPKVK